MDNLEKTRAKFKALLEEQIRLAKLLALEKDEEILVEAISDLRLIIVRKAASIKLKDEG